MESGGLSDGALPDVRTPCLQAAEAGTFDQTLPWDQAMKERLRALAQKGPVRIPSIVAAASGRRLAR